MGEKTTWKAWRTAHPDTLVLSVAGAEHVAWNPYAPYLASDGTFRGQPPADRRLPAKEPIFAFHAAGKAWAVPHRRIVGSLLLEVRGTSRRLLLSRAAGAPSQASTGAWWVDPQLLARSPAPGSLVAAAKAGRPGFVRADGFDTFWYTWAGVNAGSRILPGEAPPRGRRRH